MTCRETRKGTCPPASLLHLGRSQNGIYMLITMGSEEIGMSVHFPTKWFFVPYVTFSGTIVMRVSDTSGSSQYKSIYPPTTYRPMLFIEAHLYTQSWGDTQSLLCRDYKDACASEKSTIRHYTHALCFIVYKACSHVSS